MWIQSGWLGLLLILLGPTTSVAEVHEQIKFVAGASHVSIRGNLIRGEEDTYDLWAKAGQLMTVTISSTTNNAVLRIYNKVQGSWHGLEGARKGDDATSWNDRLPKGSGNFRIVVATTRGNAEYTLKVSIK